MSIANGGRGRDPLQPPPHGPARRRLEHALEKCIGTKAALAGKVDPVKLQVAVWRILTDHLDRLSAPVVNAQGVHFDGVDETTAATLKRLQDAGGGWALVRIGPGESAARKADGGKGG